MNPGELKFVEEQQCKGVRMILETPEDLQRQLRSCYQWQVSQPHWVQFTSDSQGLEENWEVGINPILQGSHSSCCWRVSELHLGSYLRFAGTGISHWKEEIKVCCFSTQSQPLSKLCDHELRLRTVVNLKPQPRAENLWDLMLLIPPALTFTRSDC